MDAESTIAFGFVAAIGVACLWIGCLGRNRRIDFAMGGSTRENSTQASWDKANRAVGNVFLGYGAVCAMGAGIGLIVGNRLINVVMALVVAATVALLIAVIIAATRIKPTGPTPPL